MKDDLDYLFYVLVCPITSESQVLKKLTQSSIERNLNFFNGNIEGVEELTINRLLKF